MRRTDTRARLIELAEDHLMRHGYNGFSFRDLAAELSVKSSAVHYHFPTKPDLIVAAVERYGQRFDAWRQAVSHLSEAQQLLAYIALGQRVVRDGRVCALGMLQSESATLPQAVRVAVDAVYRSFLDFYSTRLSAAREAGEAVFVGESDVAAEVLGCTLIGAQHLGRSRGPEAYGRVMRLQAEQMGIRASGGGLLQDCSL